MVDGAQGLGVEAIVAVAADAMFADEAGAAEQAQVLGDGGAGNRESVGDLSGGQVALKEKVENGATRRIGEGAEDGVGRKRNGRVSHNA